MNFTRIAPSLLALAFALAAPGAHAAEKTGTGDTPAATEAKPAAVKPSDLTDEILYDFLLAEIAGQRGHLGVASDFYLKLARETRNPALVQRATEVAIFSRRPQQALEAARIWQEVDPQSPQANQASALLLINAGKLDEAASSMAYILNNAPAEQRPHWFLTLPTLLAKTSDKQASLKLVQTLTKPYPDLAEARFALAQAYASAGQVPQALEEIRTAEKLRPNWEQAVLLETHLLQTPDNSAALKRLQEFVANNPDASEARLAYAKLLARDNQFLEAQAQFDILQQRFPTNTDLMVARALLEFQLGAYDKAAGLFQAALDGGYTQQDAVHFYMGQNEEARHRFSAAKSYYQQVQNSEYQWDAKLRLAGLQARDGDINAARATLHSLKTSDPQQRIELVQAEAQLLGEAHQYQTAYDLLASALRKQPGQPDLLYDQAMMAEKLGRLDILESNLRKLLQLKPDNAQIYNALGYTLADRTTRLSEAQDLLTKALQLSPNDPFILDSMGWLNYRQGKLDAALGFLQRAYSSRPDPEIAAHLGEVLWQQGKQQEARTVWQGAMTRHPENEALQAVVRKFAP